MLEKDIEKRADYVAVLDQISEVMGDKRTINILLQFNDKLQWIFRLFRHYGIGYYCNLSSSLELNYRFHGNYDYSQDYSS
jgi:hypothetical protein